MAQSPDEGDVHRDPGLDVVAGGERVLHPVLVNNKSVLLPADHEKCIQSDAEVFVRDLWNILMRAKSSPVPPVRRGFDRNRSIRFQLPT